MGAPAHLAVRPLIYGLTSNRYDDVDLVYDEPGRVASALSAGSVDAALVPSIEYLRGVGRHVVGGPALVARGGTPSLVLVAQKDVAEIERIAVNQHCRTPVAVLRIVLDRLHGVLPDLCVLKGQPEWKKEFDGILLAGDRGLDYLARRAAGHDIRYDLGEMWQSLFSVPLVLSLWAYNDERLGDRLAEVLTDSRNFGMSNLSLLADGVSRTCAHDSQLLYNYYSQVWSYDLGRQEKEGLGALEESALEYHLIQHPRREKLVTG